MSRVTGPTCAASKSQVPLIHGRNRLPGSHPARDKSALSSLATKETISGATTRRSAGCAYATARADAPAASRLDRKGAGGDGTLPVPYFDGQGVVRRPVGVAVSQHSRQSAGLGDHGSHFIG